MCLAIIYTPQKKKVLLDSLPEEVVAYKLIFCKNFDWKKLKDINTHYTSIWRKYHFKLGLNKDTNRFRFFYFPKYLKTDNGKRYKQGFHCFENLTDASCCLWGKAIRIRFKKEWILEIGKQDTRNNGNTYVVSNFVIDSFEEEKE